MLSINWIVKDILFTNIKDTYVITYPLEYLSISLDKSLSFIEFKDKILPHIPLINEDLASAYGFDMVLYISSKSNLFKIENIKIDKDLTISHIIPGNDMEHLKSYYLMFESNTYPVIYKPQDWKKEN